MRPHPRSLLFAVALCVGLASCASDDGQEVQELRAELTSRSAAEEELNERLDRLDDELAALGADVSTATRIDDLEDHLARVEATLTVLDDRLGDEAAARQEATEEAEVAVSDLRSTVAGLQNALEELRGETEELRTLYETLRDRMDRQQRG